MRALVGAYACRASVRAGGRACVRAGVRACGRAGGRVGGRACTYAFARIRLQLARREDEMMRMNERMRQPGGFSLQSDNLREANAQQTLMIKRLQSQVHGRQQAASLGRCCAVGLYAS